MFRGQNWIILCTLAILAIILGGIGPAVTPAAASAPNGFSSISTGTLATTLHSTKVIPPDPSHGVMTSDRPLSDGCLLCYSPFHTLLSHLSSWMGK